MHNTPSIDVNVRLRDFGGPWLISKDILYHDLNEARLEFKCYQRVLISSNSVVYDQCVAPFLKTTKNQNVTVFAYGQTGSGKTYTMFGTKKDPGIVQRCLYDIFQSEKMVEISFLEIYNDKMCDLLLNDECACLVEKIASDNNESFVCDIIDECKDFLAQIELQKGIIKRKTPIINLPSKVFENNSELLSENLKSKISVNDQISILHNEDILNPLCGSDFEKKGLVAKNQIEKSPSRNLKPFSNYNYDWKQKQQSRKDLSSSRTNTHTSINATGKNSKDFQFLSEKNRKSKEIRVFSTATNSAVSNLSKIEAKTPEIALAFIQIAQKHRITASTKINSKSSRSHAIIQISASGRCLTLIDLAGSERAGEDAQRNIEGAHINKSLLSLSRAIGALGRNEKPAYRESKLTRILQPSLSGNAAVVALCTISPEIECTSESLATLRFAAGLSVIKLKERLVQKECECKCCLKLKKIQNVLDNDPPLSSKNVPNVLNINQNQQKSNGNISVYSEAPIEKKPFDKDIQYIEPADPLFSDACENGGGNQDVANDKISMKKKDFPLSNNKLKNKRTSISLVPLESKDSIEKVFQVPSHESFSDFETSISSSQQSSKMIHESDFNLKSDTSETKRSTDEKNIKKTIPSLRDKVIQPEKKIEVLRSIDFNDLMQPEELVLAYKEVENLERENKQLRCENILYLDRIKSLEETVSNLMAQNPSKRINDLYVLEKNMFNLQIEMVRRRK